MKTENKPANAIGFGICHLSIVPLRAQPTSTSEQVSQLVFGDTFQVFKESPNQKFVFIIIDADQYQGWIEKSRWRKVTLSCYNQAVTNQSYVLIDNYGVVKYPPYQQTIFIASSLPLYHQGILHWDDQPMELLNQVHSIDGQLEQDFILEMAFRFLGTPYLWGGKTIVGVDCSGLVQQVFKLAGYQLPRDAYQQAEMGTNVPNITAAISSDLAFFAREGKVIHVGIIIRFEDIHQLDEVLAERLQKRLENINTGNAEVKPNVEQPFAWVIHAYDWVRVDVLDERGIFNLDEHQYTHLNHSIKRLIIKNKMDLIK